MGEEQRSRHFRVIGRVQGVGFRWFAKRAADELGLRGWVRNCHDGTVEALATGAEHDLTLFARRLRQGPGYAVVREVEEADIELDRSREGFDITY